MFNLFNKSSKNHTSAPTSVKKENILDNLPEDVKAEYDKRITLLKNILLDVRADTLALSMIERFLAFVWDLPASAEHHHSRPFGLFVHSLETGLHNLKEFDGKLFFQFKDGSIDSHATRGARPRQQYARFLTGLLADIGEAANYAVMTDKRGEHENRKVGLMIKYLRESMNYEIQDSETQEKSYAAIAHAMDVLIKSNTAGNEAVLDDEHTKEMYAHWVAGLLHDIGKASEYVVTTSNSAKWNPLKEGLFSFVINHNSDIKKEYIADKTYSLHKMMYPFFASRMLSPSDYAYIGVNNCAELVSGEKFKSTVEADMQSAASDINETATKYDLSLLLIDTIRTLLTSGKYYTNALLPGCWVMDDYTAVAFTVLDEARIILQNSGHKIDPKFGVLRILTAKGYLKTAEGGWKAISDLTIESTGNPFSLTIVQIKNDILWKDMVKPGLCHLKLKITNKRR